jgi:hypothetical protein
MSTHAIQIASMYSKWCNVYYLSTPSLGWIGQIKSRSLSLASARSASWLAHSLHPRSLTPIWSWMHGCTKPMSTHAHPWTIILHPCPLMNNNIAPMPTQNPWVWVGMGMGMGTQCRALPHTHRQLKPTSTLGQTPTTSPPHKLWSLGPLHTRSKSRGHEIVRAQKKKKCPKVPIPTHL